MNAEVNNLWSQAFIIRCKYDGMMDDKTFKDMYDETEALYNKYAGTEAELDALNICNGIREIFSDRLGPGKGVS